MKLNRPATRRAPETIIALIDVVFFLLIFFMIVGRMDASAPFDVFPATARTGQDLPAGGVMISIGKDGEIALDGQIIERSTLILEVINQLEDSPDISIRINAHREAKLTNLLPLVGEFENAGARDIVLIVTPGEG